VLIRVEFPCGAAEEHFDDRLGIKQDPRPSLETRNFAALGFTPQPRLGHAKMGGHPPETKYFAHRITPFQETAGIVASV
jgi:hypothetical protein